MKEEASGIASGALTMDLFEREAPKLPDYGITRGADRKKEREGGGGGNG